MGGMKALVVVVLLFSKFDCLYFGQVVEFGKCKFGKCLIYKFTVI